MSPARFDMARLVGRSDELGQLQDALDAVKGGAARSILVRGDAGIGKSRLLAEIGARAKGSGLATLTGRCFDQERSFPYAPLIDMLRPLLATEAFAEKLQALGPLAQPLGYLLPEIAPHLSALPSIPPLAGEVEKQHLFAALTALFLLQARDGPLLVVFEDLHWSDEASLEFLLHLVRRLADRPIFLLLSARDTGAGDAWTALLSGLDREPFAGEIWLHPLTRDEVGQLLMGILDQPQPPSDEFVGAVYALSEGNPFFAEEICTSLIASGDLTYTGKQWRRKPLSQLQIPDSLQRVVQQRLERLSPDACQLIDIAAISGRSFDVAALKALTAHDDARLLLLLKELISARLIVEESAERYAFRHALTREALYERLLARERQGLHAQLVEAIEHAQANAIDAPVEALAYHAIEAGLWPQALDYAQRAGEKALALDAPHAAAEQLSQAIRAAAHLSEQPSATLHRLRGRAYDTLGDFDLAREDYETALDAAHGGGDQPMTWQLFLDLALLWGSRDYERAGDYCRQALDLARAMEEPSAMAHSLNRLGNWLMNSGQPFEALDTHREALDLFQSLDDRAGIAATLDLLAMTSNMCGEFVDTVRYYEQAVPILRELNDRKTLASSLTMLSNYTLDEALVREALELTREIGWRSGEAYALQYLGSLLAYKGQVGQGLGSAQEGLELAQAIDHRLWQAWGHLVLGLIHLDLLALELAARHLQSALAKAREVGSSFMTTLASGLLASTYVEEGRLEEAAGLLPEEFSAATMRTQFALLKAGVELRLAGDDVAQALQLLDGLALPQRANWPGAMTYFYGLMMQLRGEALTRLDRLQEARAELQDLLAHYDQKGVRLGQWRAAILLGRAHKAAGDRQEAAMVFDAARHLIEELAATMSDEELREQFRRRALETIPAVRPLTPRQTAKAQYDGLTRREREVAAVVARGLSNQEIAESLVISVKTVEAHITRILSKLDFSSRAQIAAWAVEKGLYSSPK